MSGIERHTCNAFCRGDEHCTLIYTDATDIDKIIRTFKLTLGLDVLRIEPAREALPRDQHPAARQKPIKDQRDLDDDAPALLVWWRTQEVSRRDT